MKRRQFLRSLPILTTSPLTFISNSIEKTRRERHLVGLGTAACTLVNSYGNRLGFTSMTLIDSFPTRNQEVSAKFISFNCHWNEQNILFSSSKDVQTPTLPLDPSIKSHLDNLSGDLVFVSGLGNGTGSVLSQSLGTQYVHEHGCQKWIVTLPFQFEGKIKYEKAYGILRSLMDWHDCLSFFDLDDIREKYGNLSIRSAYEKVDIEVLKLIELNIELD